MPTDMDCKDKYNVINFLHEWHVIPLFALRFQRAIDTEYGMNFQVEIIAGMFCSS